MLDYFREFQALATHLNFTTAARELGVSQSCLSRHIADLEREIGFTLLERGPVKLTAAGQRFLTEVGQAFSRIDAITRECRELAKLGPQKITIATIIASDIATASVYRCLSELHAEFPTLTHRFADNRKLTIRKVVEAGQADVGVLCHVPVDLDPSLTLEHLYNNPFGAILHRDDPLAKGPLHFADLCNHSVVFSANRQFTTWVEGMRTACERYGCTPSFKMKDANTIADFLISMQPGEVVFSRTDTFRSDMRNLPLVAVDFADEGRLTYPTYLLYRTDGAPAVVGRFLELMRADAARLKAAGTVC